MKKRGRGAPEAEPPRRLYLILLAGGQGTRARGQESEPPKQFRHVAGRMLLSWSVRELSAAAGVAGLVIALPEPWWPAVEAETAALGLPCAWLLAPAGKTRTASTWAAAEALDRWREPAEQDLVAVHDTARPFASRALLERVVAAAAAHGAAVPGLEVADTIVRLQTTVDEVPRAGYLERQDLRALQTPQAFRWGDFHAAHRWCAERGLCFTDDGGLLAVRGLPPVVVEGEARNWKVTTQADLRRAEIVLGGDESGGGAGGGPAARSPEA